MLAISEFVWTDAYFVLENLFQDYFPLEFWKNYKAFLMTFWNAELWRTFWTSGIRNSAISRLLFDALSDLDKLVSSHPIFHNMGHAFY